MSSAELANLVSIPQGEIYEPGERGERRFLMQAQEEEFGWSVRGPAPSDTPGKEMGDWKLREGSQMQTVKPQPETKEKAITEYTKALRKPLLNEGW